MLIKKSVFQKKQMCMQWWIDNLDSSFKPIQLATPDMIIESDQLCLVYNCTWDIGSVLKHISDNSSGNSAENASSLKHLKSVMLLALTRGQRLRT